MEAFVVERTLTELDHVRLMNLVHRNLHVVGSPTQLRAIEEMLDASAIMPSRQVPPDIVTMYSKVLLRDPRTGEYQALTLCYPADAMPAEGLVSVLSPLGGSLLGLQVGSVARWATPGGGERTAEILAILFQPEASGDYAM